MKLVSIEGILPAHFVSSQRDRGDRWRWRWGSVGTTATLVQQNWGLSLRYCHQFLTVSVRKYSTFPRQTAHADPPTSSDSPALTCRKIQPVSFCERSHAAHVKHTKDYSPYIIFMCSEDSQIRSPLRFLLPADHQAQSSLIFSVWAIWHVLGGVNTDGSLMPSCTSKNRVDRTTV